MTKRHLIWRTSPGFGPGLLAVVVAAVRPALLLLAVTCGIATMVGAAVGEFGPPYTAALATTLVCAVSLVAHESAHLVLIRIRPSWRSAGEVHGTLTDVWCECVPMSPVWTIGSAVAGPLVGASSCYALYAAGLSAWVCTAVGFVQLANLLPFIGDGHLAFTSAATLVRDKRWAGQVARNGSERVSGGGC